METQELDRRLVSGWRSREDGEEERVEEVYDLTAGDEDDDLIVLRKLRQKV